MAIQKKTIQQNFVEVLFIMLHKVVLTIEPVYVVVKCNHWNDWSQHSSGSIYCAIKGYSNIWVCRRNTMTIQMKRYWPLRFNGSPALATLSVCVVLVVVLKFGSSRYTSTAVKRSCEDVTSRLYYRSLIIPSRLPCKTFTNLFICMKLTLETPKKIMSRRWLDENGIELKTPVQSVQAIDL